MSDPVNYRQPATAPRDAAQRAARTRSALLVGMSALSIGSGLLLLPLLWGRWEFNKFVVVAGIIGACWGACCLLLGGLEWLKGRSS